MMTNPRAPKLTLKRLVSAHDQLGLLIMEHQLNHLRAEENFLVTIYLAWMPLVTRARQERTIPPRQEAYWTAALAWLDTVLTHPEWATEMLPFTEDYELTAAMSRVESAAWRPATSPAPVVDMAIAGMQVKLREFQLATQSVGELLLIQRYWEATNTNEKD